MVIAPVTITRARQRVLDFSEHFMDLGISIMIKKPAKQAPGVFSFMLPVGTDFWAGMVVSYFAVAMVMLLSHCWRRPLPQLTTQMRVIDPPLTPLALLTPLTVDTLNS